MIQKLNPTQSEPTWVTRFLQHSHRKSYPAKAAIIHEGDESDTLYYIIEGSVSVVVEDEEGREIILSYLNPGEFFGEMGLFDDDMQRSAWVVARNDCELAEINYEEFRRIAMQAGDIVWAIAEQLTRRLRRTNAKVRDLAFLDVTGRVAHTLLELSKEPDAITHPDGMQIHVTRQEIARIVGCSREMVGRVLKELEDQGLISAHGKTVVVYGTR